MTPEERLSEFTKFGSKLGLERMSALCAALGDPHKKLRVIHVAGTNGKGSVCRFIYEVLLAHGYSCGLYISPFITCFNERIQLDGEYISDADLDVHLARAADAAHRLAEARPDDSPTEFEVVTAAAFSYFADKAPDFVVLEVGLGGDGDSTNVTEKPLVSVITSISYDHMDRLGETIEEIAASKAGIIKHGCPVVSAARGAAAVVIARRAYELGAPLTDAARAADRAKVYLSPCAAAPRTAQTFSVSLSGRRYDGIELSVYGRHQIENAVCALLAIDILRERKFISLSGEALRAGMMRARMPGRFEQVSFDPLVILDGAHNAAGAEALARTVSEVLPGKRIISIVGALVDKDALSIIETVKKYSKTIIFTSAPGERGQSGTALLAAQTNPAAMTAIDDPKDAVRAALAELNAGNFDALIVCGSLYLVSSIRPLFI